MIQTAEKMIDIIGPWIVEKDVDPNITKLERKLQRKLDKLFTKAFLTILNTIEEQQAQGNLLNITDPITKMTGPATDVIMAELLSFMDIPTFAFEAVRQSVFIASTRTLARMQGNVMQIIAEGYREGLGGRELARNLKPAFSDMRKYELERVSRTEIKVATGQNTQQQYLKAGVQFQQWLATNDGRTRESHVDVNGEIVRVGEPFSNGLRFPGDTASGDLDEFINCRCTTIPFLMPPGKIPPPGKTSFRESELISLKG